MHGRWKLLQIRLLLVLVLASTSHGFSQELPPLFSAHSLDTLNVRKGTNLQLEVMVDDPKAEIFWFFGRKEICKGNICDIDTTNWSGERGDIHVVARNSYGSEGIIFMVKFEGDPLSTPSNFQPELVRPRAPYYFPIDGFASVQALLGNGRYESGEQVMFFGKVARKIPKKGSLFTSVDELLLLSLPQGSKTFVMKDSEVLLEESAKKRLKIGLMKGSIRMIKPEALTIEGTETVQFLRVSNWFKVVVREFGDVIVARSSDRHSVVVTVVNGEIEIWHQKLGNEKSIEQKKQSEKEQAVGGLNPTLVSEEKKLNTGSDNSVSNSSVEKSEKKEIRKEKKSPWIKRKFAKGLQFLVTKSGKISIFYEPPPVASVKEEKVTASKVNQPPPVPPSFQDLVILSRILENPDDVRSDIQHPTPSSEQEKVTKPQQKQSNKKPLIYRGLDFVDPVDGIVKKLVNRILDDSITLKLGFLSYSTGGIFSEQGIATPGMLIETNHYFNRKFSFAYGLTGFYNSEMARLQYLSAGLSIRYFLWSSHPEGLAQIQGIEAPYQGLRPFGEFGLKLGQFVIKQEQAGTHTVSSELVGFWFGLGTYYHFTKAVALEAGLSFEHGLGTGTFLFNTTNVLGFIGPVVYF